MTNATVPRQHVLYDLQGALESTLKFNNVTIKANQWHSPRVDMGTLLQLISKYDWRFMVGILLLLIFLLTYLATSLKSKITTGGKKPPIVPYWVPFLGNLIPFVWDPAGFCSKITQVAHFYTLFLVIFILVR